MHESLADYVVDLVQNSIESAASYVLCEYRMEGDRLSVRIADNGPGMDAETRKNALDPFYTDGVKHPERRVGLGLPFLVQMVEAVDGTWSVESRQGRGTELSFSVPLSHIDLPPEGAVVPAMATILSFAGEYELEIRRSRRDREYRVLRSELIEALGELESVGARTLLREYLKSQEESLHE